MLNYYKFRSEYPSKTVTELIREVFERIDKYKHLNIFITLNAESALKSAVESDKRFSEGTPRRLEGMLIAVKDNMSTKGLRTTCAGKMLHNYIPVYSATAIERLEAEGAIIIGKTNMDEFAMGSSNETSYFGPVLNPLNNEYVSGGSSGGSAAAVSAGLCHVALGSDTGGSVRQPAAFCGVYGLKPTYGRISRYGLIALASSLDQIGILSPNVEEIALILDVISGKDEMDATVAPYEPTRTFEEIHSELPQGFKVGILSEDIMKECSPDVQVAYINLQEKVKSLGGVSEYIEFTNTQAWIPVYQVLMTAEASSNLARYDGVRFGFRTEDKDDRDFVTKTRTEGFGDEAKRRIMLGTFVLSSGYYEQYYLKAQKARRLIYDNYLDIFKKVDFILMPTTPTPAFKLGEKTQDPIAMYLSDFFTVSANLSGIPAINIPAGFAENGLQIGMQIQAPHFEEGKLMNLARSL
ncbi:MAG: Asp-tRNA(Asn)/Glu-tRNA(Gln) amidotransferase subunit GatA [bacterium]